ncbi:MAG TPA: HEAT repeat domain-containing protein [Solirubrobacteraceae bacterium]|jgi:HEAT repeat protein
MRHVLDIEVARSAATLLQWFVHVKSAVLADFVSALGRTQLPQLAHELAPLADHADTEVRVAVAQALGELADGSAATVAALVLLSRDADDEVRSWATFALAAEQLDGAAGVRDALAARLRDDSEDVRVEAVRGLARRGDPAAIDAAFELAPSRCDDPLFRDAVERLGLGRHFG